MLSLKHGIPMLKNISRIKITKIISWPSYLYKGNPHIGNTVFTLIWDLKSLHVSAFPVDSQTIHWGKLALWTSIPWKLALTGTLNWQLISHTGSRLGPMKIAPTKLTHCGLAMQYGDIDLGQYSFRYWLFAWWHQAVTWTNVDLSSVMPSIP